MEETFKNYLPIHSEDKEISHICPYCHTKPHQMKMSYLGHFQHYGYIHCGKERCLSKALTKRHSFIHFFINKVFSDIYYLKYSRIDVIIPILRKRVPSTKRPSLTCLLSPVRKSTPQESRYYYDNRVSLDWYIDIEQNYGRWTINRNTLIFNDIHLYKVCKDGSYIKRNEKISDIVRWNPHSTTQFSIPILTENLERGSSENEPPKNSLSKNVPPKNSLSKKVCPIDF